MLFHVTANADWSDLPLSGLFVEMLRRLVALSAGVASPAPGAAPLAPASTLDGFGQMVAPPSTAAALPANEVAAASASPRHPPGLYGPENGRRALNLSAHVPRRRRRRAARRACRADRRPAPERAVGPWLIALALALLAIDLLVSLRLRGLLRPAAAALLLAVGGHARRMAPRTRADEAAPKPGAGHAARLHRHRRARSSTPCSRMGLAGPVRIRERAHRREPRVRRRPVGAGRRRPQLLSAALLADLRRRRAASGQAIAALNDYMSHGGIIVIDTRDGGSGEGLAPGAASALSSLARDWRFRRWRR